MAVSKKAKALYNAVFEGIETWAANTILKIQEKRDLEKYYPKTKMPKDFAKEYRKYWSKWAKVSPKWGWYYAERNGNKDVRYVPHNLYYTVIDQHFNSRKLGWGFNDKNYYSKTFSEIKQPRTVARNIGTIFTDECYRQITVDDALEKILKFDEVICKPSQESGSGRNIEFWNCKEDVEKIKTFLRDCKNEDYIIQQTLKQHEELNKIHASSINTVRICSILLSDGVHILSSCLRMGMNKSRVDNVTAGGISVGINPDGTLQQFAYNYYTGEKTDTHPQGYVFKGNKVPFYEKAVELVEKAHPVIGHFRLVSWDIAIDNEGDAVLIEANMRKGGINLHQFSNGPLFGELTEKIMDEVYGR